MIYFAKIDVPNGPIKIGYAKDPSKRIKQFQKHMPWRVKIIHIIEGDRKRETEIHRECSCYKMVDSSGREWFKEEAMKFLKFKIRIEKENLTAERHMTKEEYDKYLKILLETIKEDL